MYKEPYKMMTVMTHRDHLAQLGLSVSALADAQAEALAAVGLRGQDATRAMKRHRRERARHRFSLVAASVQAPRVTDIEELRADPWAPDSRYTKRYTK